MIREQADTHIDRSVDVVFAYMTDIGRFPEWSTVVQEATLTSAGPLGVRLPALDRAAAERTLKDLGRETRRLFGER